MTTLEKIKQLRDVTGAGMLDCKNFLLRANDDYDAALLALRVAGFKPKAGRISAEGAVFSFTGEGTGALVELNCETDFVANTEAFQAAGKRFAAIVGNYGYATAAELLTDRETEDILHALVASTKENIVIRRVVFYGVKGEG